jgi:predicted nucleotidyltransferase
MVGERPIYSVTPAERARVCDALAFILASESDVAFAYLFGSFADQAAFRDIDVGVSLARMSPDAAADRAFRLADRVASDVGYPVDVIALNGRPVTFKFHVYRGQPLVVRDEDLLARELEETMRAYFDLEPRLLRATLEAFAT